MAFRTIEVEPVRLDPSLISAFGTLETNELTPVVQLDFVHGINTQTGLGTTANSATVDTDARRLRLQCGTNSAGSAIFNSRQTAKYRPGQGITARFTAVFGTAQASNTQIVGAGNAVDGYFFGYNGTSFGILYRSNSTDTWIPQLSFNVDKIDGSGDSKFRINPQFGNVYMIKYPYLGYGNIEFFVEDQVTSRFILVHVIKYVNTTASTQISNPNLFFYAQNLNAGNTTNVIMYVGSVGFFLSGARSFIASPRWAIDHYKTGITAETNIVSIRNATTYNTVTNRSLIRLHSLSAGGDSTTGTVVVVRLRIGATLGGVPAYTTINGTTADSGVTITSGNSIASYDTAGTTATGGTLIYNLSIAAPGNTVIDLTPFDLVIAPAETATFSAFATASSTVAVAVNWSEDI